MINGDRRDRVGSRALSFVAPRYYFEPQARCYCLMRSMVASVLLEYVFHGE